MKNYTDKDILKELKLLIPKVRTRKRSYLDKRNYIIAILYYKFDYTEEKISNLFKLTADPIERSSICPAKKQPGFHVKNGNMQFLLNTQVLVKRFPFDLPETIEDHDRTLSVPVSMKLHLRIINYCNKHGYVQNQGIRKLLDTALKIDESNYTVKLVKT